MTFGISRVHGAVISPKNLAGVGLTDFTLTFLGPVATTVADASVPGGAFDQVFRTAVGTIASVSRIGTLNTSTGAVRFAVEMLGVEASDNGGYLGTGPTDSSPASTAAALQAAIQALGTVTNSIGGVIGLSSATVAAFVY